ncbi:MAG TPA: aminopeptidase [Nitrososphaerales archaeon]|nr:aminopeptidase [Nitrososphaerales archaeon]
MADSMLSQIAAKILKESLHVKKGQTITVETWNTGLPLAKEVVKQARRMGCLPVTVFEDENAYVDGVKNTPGEFLGQMGKHEYAMLATTDAYVFIPGPPLGAYYGRISRKQYADSTRYNNSWYEAAEKAKLRGVRLSYGYVGRDLARYLGKSTGAVAAGQLKGILNDFGRIGRKGRAIEHKLKDGAKASISTEGAELRFKLKGATTVEDGIVDDGDLSKGENMAYLPPGMVTKDVDPASARGTVKLSPTLTRLGVAESLTLKFDKGRLVEWSSPKPAKFVEEVLKAIEPKNRVFNYLTIGLNDKLTPGLGADRFVAGSVGIAGFGFVGMVHKASLNVGGVPVVKNGKL